MESLLRARVHAENDRNLAPAVEPNVSIRMKVKPSKLVPYKKL